MKDNNSNECSYVEKTDLTVLIWRKQYLLVSDVVDFLIHDKYHVDTGLDQNVFVVVSLTQVPVY